MWALGGEEILALHDDLRDRLEFLFSSNGPREI
jgi:hypothetical protein